MDISWKILYFVIILVSCISVSSLVFPQSLATLEPVCVYSLTGFLVSANSVSCPSSGTPTVISNVYGHADPNNGVLLYDENLYFAMLVGGGYGAWNLPNEMTATNQWKSEICPDHYDQNGNFFAGWASRHYSLSDAQKRVLLDMQANYSVFICPFTGTPTPYSPPASGLRGPITSGTVNVMDLGKNNTQSNVTNSVSAKTWYLGKGLKQGDFFRYNVCYYDYHNCKPLEIDFWVQNQSSTSHDYFLQMLAIDGNKTQKGTVMTTPDLDPVYSDPNISDYSNVYKNAIIQLGNIASSESPKDFDSPSWYHIGVMGGVGPIAQEQVTVKAGTFDTWIIGWHKGVDNKIWVVPSMPFPVKAQTWVDCTCGRPPPDYRFELLETGNSQTFPPQLVKSDLPTHRDSSALLSPLMQFKSGTMMQDIKCNDRLTLIIKEQNLQPSCVKPNSLARLLSHGWITLEKFQSVNNLNTRSKSEPALGQNKSDAKTSSLPIPKSDLGKIISKTSTDGVITIRSQKLCIPLKHVVTDSITDKTAFNMLHINFPTSGQASLDGIVSLSSSKNTTITPVSSGQLLANYNLEKNSNIVNCGISYCKGENCNPDKELPTINVSVFVNDTKGYCPPSNGPFDFSCRGPFASTDASISTNSPSMEPDVPYLYKFYLVDSLGKYEEWFFALEYHPQ